MDSVYYYNLKEENDFLAPVVQQTVELLKLKLINFKNLWDEYKDKIVSYLEENEKTGKVLFFKQFNEINLVKSELKCLEKELNQDFGKEISESILVILIKNDQDGSIKYSLFRLDKLNDEQQFKNLIETKNSTNSHNDQRLLDISEEILIRNNENAESNKKLCELQTDNTLSNAANERLANECTVCPKIKDSKNATAQVSASAEIRSPNVEFESKDDQEDDPMDGSTCCSKPEKSKKDDTTKNQIEKDDKETKDCQTNSSSINKDESSAVCLKTKGFEHENDLKKLTKAFIADLTDNLNKYIKAHSFKKKKLDANEVIIYGVLDSYTKEDLFKDIEKGFEKVQARTYKRNQMKLHDLCHKDGEHPLDSIQVEPSKLKTIVCIEPCIPRPVTFNDNIRRLVRRFGNDVLNRTLVYIFLVDSKHTTTEESTLKYRELIYSSLKSDNTLFGKLNIEKERLFVMSNENIDKWMNVL